MLESQLHERGAAACHARVGLSRHRSGDLRRPRAAKLPISHCISPPSGFKPTIRAAPEPRADRHALTTLGRARPTPTTTRQRALLPLQRRPGAVLLPEAPRRAARTAAARGRLRRTSSEVGQRGGRLRQRPGRARGHHSSCRRGVSVFFGSGFLSARLRERGCWCLHNSANLMAHSRTAMRRAL